MELNSDSWSKSDFDYIKWTNNVLENQKSYSFETYVINILNELNEKKTHTSESLNKLIQNIYCKNKADINNRLSEIEENLTDINANVLKLYGRISQADTKNSPFIGVLNNLDAYKSKLLIIKNNLQQIENWNSFENIIRQCLEHGDYSSAARRILELQSSLETAPDSIEWHEKRNNLVNLLQFLVDKVTSDFEHVLNVTKNEITCKQLVAILFDLNQHEKFIKIYTDFYLKQLNDRWQKSCKDLVQFYHILHKSYSSDLTFLQNLQVPLPILILMNVLEEFLLNLKPEINFNFDNFSSLIDLQASFSSFLQLILTYDDVKNNSTQFAKFSKTILNPFCDFQNKSIEYEVAIFEKNIYFEINQNKIFKSNFYQLNSIPQKINNVLRSSLERCQKFSGFVTLDQFLNKFRDFLKNKYFTIFRKVIKQLLQKEFESAHDELWDLLQIPVSFLKHFGDLLICFKQINSNLIENLQNYERNNINPILYLLNDTELTNWKQLIDNISNNSDLFSEINKDLQELSQETYHVLIEMLMKPVLAQFHTIYTVFSDSTINDLPHLSQQPQEYITLIGQYLITLPQHLESYFSNGNHSLINALQLIDLKFNSISDEDNFEADLILILVETLSQKICDLYCDMIFDIKKLNDTGCKQLVSDISMQKKSQNHKSILWFSLLNKQFINLF